ncbi:MAG: hypothetical protein Q9228_006561 [Teloschistes exilis]
MFSAFTEAGGSSLQTQKVLIIINLQNDSLIAKDDIQITANHDFVDKIKAVVPHFRSVGEIIWVRTEISRIHGPVSPDPAKVEAEAAQADAKNREQRRAEEENLADDTSSIESDTGGVQTYHPSSRSKAKMKQASARTRVDQRWANMEHFDDEHEPFEDIMTKPRKGRDPAFFVGGTHGAELADEILPVVDQRHDTIMTKHHYSAFDQTSLLMHLRMKLVTEVYLCGCLTNVGIYATAADAVQHGLNVTVIEDCLGYRSEDKHEEAMRQMADIMGVNGVDSEEIVEESGGIAPPDAETPMFTGPGVDGIAMTSLSLTNSQRGSAESVVGDEIPAVPPVLTPPPSNARKTLDAQGELYAAAPATSTSPPPGSPLGSPRPESASSISKLTPTISQRTSFARGRNSWRVSMHTLGPQDMIGAGDSSIVHNVLKHEFAKEAFTGLKTEVKWQAMYHRSGQVPRLVAVQGEKGKDGGIPIYRHPADESPPLLPFTPYVEKIRRELERQLGQPFNHALIQLYRDGIDHISEHSDKTLDIVRHSAIVNMSIGAQRVMTLRTKKSNRTSDLDSPGASRQTQRITMPHNSIFILGPETNMQWLHGVRADKRPLQQKSEEERSFGGERVSLTFRQIGTFVDANNKRIWGQGAREKTKSSAGSIRAGDCEEMEAMVMAFGKENHQSEFDWEAQYGKGFDVINLVASEKPKLILCQDKVANLRVQLSLLEKEISYDVEERHDQPEKADELPRHRSKAWSHGLSNIEKPILKDSGQDGSETEGDLAILFYLEKRSPYETSKEAATEDSSKPKAQNFSRAAQSNELLFAWQNLPSHGHGSRSGSSASTERPTSSHGMLVADFERDLNMWEGYAKEGGRFITGSEWTLIDCAFWPVLNEVVHHWNGFKVQRYPDLSAYHERVLGRESVQTLLEEED